MRISLLCGLFFLFLLSSVHANSISNGTFLNASDVNITLTVDAVNLSFSALNITNHSIEFQNISYNITGANFSVALLNFTTPNTNLFSSSLPNISSISLNTVVILNGLSQNISQVNIIIGTNGVTPSSPLLTFPDGSSQNPSYSYDSVGGLLTLSGVSLPPGVSTLTFDTSRRTLGTCVNFTTQERLIFVMGLLACILGLVWFGFSKFDTLGVGGSIVYMLGLAVFLTMIAGVITSVC